MDPLMYDLIDWWMGLFSFVLLAAIYAVPGVVAYLRRHNDRMAILALNLLAGWTVIGWAWALVWSLTGNTSKS